MVLWSPLRCTLMTPEVSTTSAKTGHPSASQASIAVVAASGPRASGSAYPDYATCAAAEDRGAIEAHALKVSPTTTDFIMQVSLADGVRLVSRCDGRRRIKAVSRRDKIQNGGLDGCQFRQNDMVGVQSSTACVQHRRRPKEGPCSALAVREPSNEFCKYSRRCELGCRIRGEYFAF